MTALSALLALEDDDLRTPVPLFYVQAPDGKRTWAEIDRQVVLFRDMKMLAPKVFGYAIPNAGKRNPMLARKEGICGGAFDTEWNWSSPAGPVTAWVEIKGYDKRGRAGELSPAQIDWGNRQHRLGHRVACFFDPFAAIMWLRDLGAPIQGRAAAWPRS